MPAACCLIPEEEKLFEKNFLDHSEDGRRTGMRTAMPAACCLIPEEEKLFEKNFLDLSVEEAHWDAHYHACLEGGALGCLLCLRRRKTFLRRAF